MNIIEVDNLSKSINKQTIYKNITLSIGKGDCYALIGADGEGKTTFLHTLLGFNKATSGSLTILGEKKMNHNLWKRTGYVPDDLLRSSSMTGLELLDMTINFKKKQGALDYAADLLDYFAINPNRRLRQMDYNTNKCIYLINALLAQPELLILDEPFNLLTDECTLKLQKLLADYCKKGNTVLITSDNYDDIQDIYTKFSILNNGIQVGEGMED